jgi:hypothetical protein
LPACCGISALFVSACRKSVVGSYQLDMAETKKAVEISAKEHPEHAGGKDGTIKVLGATTIDLRLEEGGKLSSRMHYEMPPLPPTDQKQSGTWKMDGKQLVLTIVVEHMTDETRCDIDGKYLRCHNESLPDMMSRYVLVRK